MDFIRTNVPSRERSEGERTGQDTEQPRQPEMGEQREPRTRRPSTSHRHLPAILTGRLRTEGRRQGPGRDGPEDESPKTPRFTLGLPNLTRNLTRAPSPTQSERPLEPAARPSMAQSHTERLPAAPQPAVPSGGDAGGRSRRPRFRGADPAESHLANIMSRARRRHRRRDESGSGGSSDENAPKRFLFCFPWIRSRRIRAHVLRCFVSGIFLLLMLTIYLALSITKNINGSEFTVLLILIILFATIFFCHGLIRICMLVIKPPNEEEEHRLSMPERMEPGGYAVPRRPIRVILAHDEEAAGIESDLDKLQPPAYGLWRESVRVDPDRIFWQRNEQASPESGGHGESRPTTGQARPPSYASDDGIEYVVEARPRSMVPPPDGPFVPPHHPSETGVAAAAAAENTGRPT
ncbi:hypothetical protein F4779DRAFT_466424 [Xylariaceae sp. FL0662B]|nr:hypothetical protein F4779DRAFT_466424 [Xylariaceae sp. FL0662B]